MSSNKTKSKTWQLELANKNMILEINARKQIQRRLNKRESLLKAIFDSSGDGLLVVDNNGQITYKNNAFMKMWNIPPRLSNSTDDNELLKFVLSQLSEPNQFLSKVKELYNSTKSDRDILHFKDRRIFERNSQPLIIENIIAGRVWNFRDITESKLTEAALGERIKELRFFYNTAEVAGRLGITLNEIYRKLVNQIPSGWQFPEITGGCITIYGKAYKTKKFKKTKWMQKEDINIKDEIIGTVEVCYLEEKPDEYEGPFLKEERELIKNFAKQLGEYITRKQAEEKLINSEERLKILFESAPDAYYINDLKGTFIDGNKAAIDLMGYTKKELIGQSFLKLKILSAKEILKASKLLIKNVQGKGTGPNEFILNRKDGRQVPVEIRTYPVKIEDKTVVLGIARDITERNQAERRLLKSEEQFRSLVNNSPDIILRVDLHGVITYVNKEYSNKKPKDIVGQTIYDLIPPDFREIARSAIKKVFKTGKSHSFENIALSIDDTVVWYKNSIGPIIENGKVQAVTIIATDISEQKQVDIMKNEFIASVSHEIKTPLTIIRESLSLLSDGIFGKLNKEQLDIVNPSLEDVDRLSRIINNLLDISRIEGQKIIIERNMVDIVKLAQGVRKSFENQATRKNIELVFAPNRESINLYIDSDKIIQVFMNLIGNAIKFTEKGKIEVVITEKANNVECCIADTGIGIERKDLGTVFDRFHQVGKIMRAGEKGAGLGLSISKGIIKLHKGRIWVNSKINKGSKFYFTVPKYSTDEIIIDNIEEEIRIAASKHIKLSLLLIRLDNYFDIESKFGVDEAKKVTKLMLQIIQGKLAPGEFSFIKGKNEVILFSDITKQNVVILFSKLVDMLTKSVLKIEKDLRVNLSYGTSLYPINGGNASELMENAYGELLKHNKT